MPTSPTEEHYAEYEQRILAYCDILGWRERIAESERDPSIVQSLVEKTEQAPHWSDLINGAKAQGKEIPYGLEVAYWSDSSLVSCRDEPEAMGKVLGGICNHANEFLENGLLCRGAIVKGRLYHRGNVMFGPAFLRAYDMEQDRAVFPRILIADDIVATMNSDPEHQRYVRQDSDGLYFLDTFPKVLPASGKPDTFSEDSFQKFRASIDKGLRGSRLDPKRRMKWNWLAKYFNDVVTRFPDLNVTPIT
jgi:hypothetical protein